jgi:hypothetical protein
VVIQDPVYEFPTKPVPGNPVNRSDGNPLPWM